jgi:hypothetical protein
MRLVSSKPNTMAMRAFDTDKRLIGVHELAVILDVSPESIYAKTSKKNRWNLNLEIPGTGRPRCTVKKVVASGRLSMDRGPKNQSREKWPLMGGLHHMTCV